MSARKLQLEKELKMNYFKWLPKEYEYLIRINNKKNRRNFRTGFYRLW